MVKELVRAAGVNRTFSKGKKSRQYKANYFREKRVIRRHAIIPDKVPIIVKKKIVRDQAGQFRPGIEVKKIKVPVVQRR